MVKRELVHKLNTLSAKYIETVGEELTYEVLAEDLALFAGARFGIINLLNKEKNHTVTKAIAGSKSLILQAMKALGFSLSGKEYPVDEYAMQMLEAKQLTRFEGVHQIAKNQISEFMVQRLETLLKTGPVYAMGLRSDERIFGDVILVFAKEGPDPEQFDSELTELLVRQIGSVIVKKQAENQRDMLIKEIHHRVKNNLQVIKSILFMEREETDNEDLKEILLGTEGRINSMAEIHEILYLLDNFSSVSMDDYFRKLTDSIKTVYGKGAFPVTVEIEAEDMALDINEAIPCGIIVNELVTNAFKYAFTGVSDSGMSSPDAPSPVIRISLIRKKNNYVLTVEDNGGMFPRKDNTEKKGTGLGKKLVEALAMQLGGAVRFKESDSGMSAAVTFPV